MASVCVDVSSAASNALVAAVTGKRIRVLGFQLIAAGDVTVTLEDSSGTNLWGPVTISANGGISATPVPDMVDVRTPNCYFETDVSKGLNLLLSAGVQVGGGLQYVQK